MQPCVLQSRILNQCGSREERECVGTGSFGVRKRTNWGTSLCRMLSSRLRMRSPHPYPVSLTTVRRQVLPAGYGSEGEGLHGGADKPRRKKHLPLFPFPPTYCGLRAGVLRAAACMLSAEQAACPQLPRVCAGASLPPLTFSRAFPFPTTITVGVRRKRQGGRLRRLQRP